MSIRSFVKGRAFPIAIFILLAQTVFYYRGSAKESTPAIAPWSQIPSEAGKWKQSAVMVIEQKVMAALQPDDSIVRAYQIANGRRTVTLFVGYFNSRRDGRAPHSPQWGVLGEGWKSMSSKIIDLPLEPSGSFPVNEYLIERGIRKEVVLYWYHHGGRVVANEVAAQIYSIPDLILHGRTDVTLVRIIVPEAKERGWKPEPAASISHKQFIL